MSTWNCLQGTVFCQAKASSSVVLLNSMMSITMANTMNWARNLKLWITIAWAKSRSVSLWFYWTLPALLASARIRRVLSPVNSALSVILCKLKAYLLDGVFLFVCFLWKLSEPFMKKIRFVTSVWHRDEVIYLRSRAGQNTGWTQVSWKGYGQLKCINMTTAF